MNASACGWEGARNVLGVRLDNLGDVLMTTPAIRAVKASVVGRRFTLLCSPSGAQGARLVPEIDDVVECRAPWVAQAANADALLPLIDTLAAGRFDAAVIFTVYSQSALPAATVLAAAGIPLRLAHCRENPYGLLTDWIRESEPADGVRHEVRRQLDLVQQVGCRTHDERLGLRIPEAARRWAHDRLATLGMVPGDPWFLIHPGASAPSRRYPPQLWGQVVRLLGERERACVVLVAAAEDEATLRIIRAEAAGRVHVLCGELDLSRLAALVELAPVILCNNSGPAHLAAAVGTPVVDVYALTNPQHTPWGVPHRLLFHDVPCRFCYRSVCPEGHHACLASIAPQDIAAAAAALLGGCTATQRSRTIDELLATSRTTTAILST